jgi:hypothetical protein
MAKITYTPLGTTGYRCDVSSADGLSLQLAVRDAGAEPAVTGDTLLSNNQSIVSEATAFAANERSARRSRNAARRKFFRKNAEQHRDVLLFIVDLADDLGSRSKKGYCSACLASTQHVRVERKSLQPVACLCGGCGAATTPCRVPGCKHFASRSAPRALGIGNFCAEHVHAIPGFTKLETRLGSLEDYESWISFDRRNAKRITTLTGTALAGGLIVAPVFFVAAPAIGGAIGAYTGLSGAAATSHGLALLGGGSLAAGGLGMAGGTAVITAAGAGLGGALGASVSASYVADDPTFGIELVEAGTGPPVVFSSGFLTEDESGWGRWRTLIRTRYPDRPVYRVTWGAKEIKQLLRWLRRSAASPTTFTKLADTAARATSKASVKLGPIAGVLTAAEFAKNPWWVARARAAMTGAVLADLIVRTDAESYVLVGHSLGARVMLEATQALATRDSGPRLESVHLLGAAVGDSIDVHGLDKALAGTLWNYWSSNDAVLKRVYRMAQAGQNAAGAVGFRSTSATVKNRNVSRAVKTHSQYIDSVELK